MKTPFHFVYAENYQKRNDYVINLPFLDENADRFHRVHIAGKKVKPIILKFKS